MGLKALIGVGCYVASLKFTFAKKINGRLLSVSKT